MTVNLRILAMICGLVFTSLAYAYSIRCNSSGDACTVYCDNGQTVGTMYWNGSRWSDGLRSSTDRDNVARQMVKAQGTACR
jgi:hypothetical protein